MSYSKILCHSWYYHYTHIWIYVHQKVKKLEVIFEEELVDDIGVGEGNGDFGISVVGVVNDVGDVVIVWGEGFEDVVVIVEIEGDGVGHVFSP